MTQSYDADNCTEILGGGQIAKCGLFLLNLFYTALIFILKILSKFTFIPMVTTLFFFLP